MTEIAQLFILRRTPPDVSSPFRMQSPVSLHPAHHLPLYLPAYSPLSDIRPRLPKAAAPRWVHSITYCLHTLSVILKAKPGEWGEVKRYEMSPIEQEVSEADCSHLIGRVVGVSHTSRWMYTVGCCYRLRGLDHCLFFGFESLEVHLVSSYCYEGNWLPTRYLNIKKVLSV